MKISSDDEKTLLNELIQDKVSAALMLMRRYVKLDVTKKKLSARTLGK